MYYRDSGCRYIPTHVLTSFMQRMRGGEAVV